MKKIGIIGSKNGCVRVINWAVKQNVEIVGVVAPPFKGWWNDRVKETAESHGLKIYNTLDELIEQSPDVIFSLSYWKIISQEHIDKVRGGIVNVHHSYLLKYRGRYSTSWAIVNARKTNNWNHGTTIHYINSKLDDGPIIDSYKCKIKKDDTAKKLHNRVEDLAFKMVTDNFYKIVNNQVKDFLEADSDFYYYDKDSNKNLEIEYGSPLNEVYDIIRAWTFDDRPKPYFRFGDKKIILTLGDDDDK